MSKRNSLQSRVLTTNFTFPTAENYTPGRPVDVYSVAWIKKKGSNPDILKGLKDFEVYQSASNPSVQSLAEILGGASGSIPSSKLNDIRFNALVQSKIIIERSPEQALTLGTALKKATSVTIGAFLGAAVVGFNPMLMIITVPTGVLLMGPVMGVARGLESGLAELIHQYIAAKSGKKSSPKKTAKKKK